MYRLKSDSTRPTRFYRTPEAIGEDMRAVAEKIEEINTSLNNREMIACMMYCGDYSMDEKAKELTYLVLRAKDVTEKLTELSEALDELKAELIESIRHGV